MASLAATSCFWNPFTNKYPQQTISNPPSVPSHLAIRAPSYPHTLDPGAPPVRSKATSDRRRLKPISTKRCTLAWCGLRRRGKPRIPNEAILSKAVNPAVFGKKTMKHQNKNVEIDGPNFKDLHVWYIEKWISVSLKRWLGRWPTKKVA